MVHELVEPFDVWVRKLGHGTALFLFPGSMHANPSFLVRFYHTGELRVVEMTDLRVYGNPSHGEKLTPTTPDDWKAR